jgi:S1-C subfamily serine protease
LEAPQSLAGAVEKCPTCKTANLVPTAATSQPAKQAMQTIDHASAVPTATHTKTWKAVIQRNRDLVPVIECRGGLGAGLLISRSGVIVTNRHVVENTDVFMATFADGTKAKASIVHRSESIDLAMIRAAVSRSTWFDLEGCISSRIEAGDEVLAIGHPRGLSFTATRGIVSEPRRVQPDGTFVQTDVAINPGNSGGPLLDIDGRLAGLNTSVRLDSHGLGFAIPAAEVVAYVTSVKAMLADGKLRLPTDEQIESLHQTMDPVQIVQAAIAGAGLEVSKVQPPTEKIDTTRFDLRTETGRRFSVYVGEQLSVMAIVSSDITPSRATRSSLLRLLDLQLQMGGPYFTVSAGDAGLLDVVLWYQRPCQGLDVREAMHAISLIDGALILHGDEVERMF